MAKVFESLARRFKSIGTTLTCGAAEAAPNPLASIDAALPEGFPSEV